MSIFSLFTQNGKSCWNWQALHFPVLPYGLKHLFAHDADRCPRVHQGLDGRAVDLGLHPRSSLPVSFALVQRGRSCNYWQHLYIYPGRCTHEQAYDSVCVSIFTLVFLVEH
jgi:hypothetical protein